MKSKSSRFLVWAFGLFVAQGIFSNAVVLPKWQKEFAPKGDIFAGSGLSPDQMLFALGGFREMVAGILWVRADSFFDDGNYDAMLPLIRLCTILDPKQLDIFSVGMWHIAYNFTDEGNRSDRRYVPYAIALGKEAQRNNPDTYEPFFETGWLWFNKVDDDYDQAVKNFEEAEKREDMLAARKNLLSVAYQRTGQIDKSLDHWYSQWDLQDKNWRDTGDMIPKQQRDTAENNLDTLIVRMAQRGYFAQKRGEGIQNYDLYPPFDVGFAAKAAVVGPGILKVDCNWNILPAGTRIRCILRDADYPTAKFADQDWDRETGVKLDPPKDMTWMQEAIYIKNRHGMRKIDMTRDQTMYPFTKDKYVLEFYWNPRSAAGFMQDKLGFLGEGMTDKNYLNLQARQGQRVIYTSFTLTRDQILRLGEWASKVPTVQTPNYVDPNETLKEKDDVILVPSLRNDKKG
ncbi:MAG: hypothetical protein JSS72_02005 [Armatimonadetes bacterium]|nr:hypothetical protein [Armatimonadota bacterium]